MNPDPQAFARHVLWKLSDIQAQVYHNQLLLVEILARQTDEHYSEVQARHSAQAEKMRQDRYIEALKEVGIDPNSDSSQGHKRF